MYLRHAAIDFHQNICWLEKMEFTKCENVYESSVLLYSIQIEP